MTIVQKFDFEDGSLYRINEDGNVKYCTLEEVLWLLSTPERRDQNGNQELVSTRGYTREFSMGL